MIGDRRRRLAGHHDHGIDGGVALLPVYEIFLDQRPSGLQLVGGALVLAGIVLVKVDEDAADRSVPDPELTVAL